VISGLMGEAAPEKVRGYRTNDEKAADFSQAWRRDFCLHDGRHLARGGRQHSPVLDFSGFRFRSGRIPRPVVGNTADALNKATVTWRDADGRAHGLE